MILVKNLPSGTKSAELQQLFSNHGTVGRVILPPSGITAIVEFLEPTEAKLAYKKLAYTKVSSSQEFFFKMSEINLSFLQLQNTIYWFKVCF